MQRESDVPIYQQLAEVLRNQIHHGDIAPGEKIPSESELMDQYRVGRNTVKETARVLRIEGLIRTEHGKGSFVRDPREIPLPYRPSIVHSREVRRQGPDQDGFTAELAWAGLTGSQRITVERRGAPEDIADRLGLSIGDPVVLRHRIQSAEGRPSAIADSWFPASLVEKNSEIMSPVDVKRGTDRVWEERGYKLVSRRDEVTARMPTSEEAQELGIAGGVPVVLVVSTKFSAGKQPVEIFVRVMPADRHVLVFEDERNA